MRKEIRTLALVVAILATSTGLLKAQDALVEVTIENIAPENGVVLTPVWVGFHSGSFDSYNGGLTSLEGLERVAEDGNNSVISQQFLDFNRNRGGYTYVDNSGSSPVSALVRTGDLTDRFRQDATVSAAPLAPGQTATQSFMLRNDGSNDFFSYVSMVLPTNDFFVANGSPVAHDISGILSNGGEISFFIGTPDGGVNDAGTERENFRFSAGNGLFPNRNLPAGQSGPNVGQSRMLPIANVVGNAFENFRLASLRNRARIMVRQAFTERTIRLLSRSNFRGIFNRVINRLRRNLRSFIARNSIDVDGLNFNEYEDGIARVTIRVVEQ